MFRENGKDPPYTPALFSLCPGGKLSWGANERAPGRVFSGGREAGKKLIHSYTGEISLSTIFTVKKDKQMKKSLCKLFSSAFQDKLVNFLTSLQTTIVKLRINT